MNYHRSRKKSVDMVFKLEQDILSGKLQAGDQIPSLRELMKIYSISKGTVERGIEELCQRGFLEKRIGAGTFVCDGKQLNKEPLAGAITIFTQGGAWNISHTSSIFGYILKGILEAAKESNCDLNSICCLGRDPMKIRQEQLDYANSCSSGIIFVGEYDAYNLDLDLRVPAVGAFVHQNFGNRMSLVEPDILDAVQAACNYFLSHGRKHVIAVSTSHPIYVYRAQLFKLFWENAGNSCELKILEEFCGETFLDEKEAYFIASDSLAQNSIKHTYRISGKLFHESGVLCSIDGKRVCCPDFYPFPSYAVDWTVVGRTLLEELICRIHNIASPVRRINVSGRFITDWK